MTELDIFNNAIHNLEKDIPITWDWKTIASNKDIGIDGELDITLNDKKVLLMVEIKKDVKNHQILNILHYNNEFQNFLIIAEKLFPKVKEKLREQNLNYLERNGKVYINNNEIFQYINNNITPKTKKVIVNRAFIK